MFSRYADYSSSWSAQCLSKKKIMKGTRTAKWDSSVDENMKYGGSDD